MSLTIDLSRRLIELDDGVQLHFPTDDGFFYLRVIALVAQKMKDAHTTAFVCIQDIEERAWTLNRDKPRASKSKTSMKTNIYQAWRGRLNPRSNKCVYEVVARDGANLPNSVWPGIQRLFESKRGQGPDRAAFRIRKDPDTIEIIPEKSNREAYAIRRQDRYPMAAKDAPLFEEHLYDFRNVINDKTKDFVGRQNVFGRIDAFIKHNSSGYPRWRLR